jgi:flavin-binding protein dodecin
VWFTKVSEIIGSSPTRIKGAGESVLSWASQTLRGITGIEVATNRSKVEDRAITENLARLPLSFDTAMARAMEMAPRKESHW